MGVVVLASVVALVYRLLGYRMRKWMSSDDIEGDDLVYRTVSASPGTNLLQCSEEAQVHNEEEEEEEEEEWIESATEAEDEAAVITLSFLNVQCICFHIVGRLPNMEGEEEQYTQADVYRLICMATVFLALLMVTTCLRASAQVTGFAARWLKMIQDFMSMSNCWCIQRMMEWQFLLWLSDKNLAAVIAAFITTSVSIFIIVGLDAIADQLRNFDLQDVPPNASIRQNSRLLTARSLNARIVTSRMLTSRAFISSPPLRSNRLSWTSFNKSVGIIDWRSWEKAVRTIINGFGLLVGLSWDKAFDVAELGVVHGFSVLARRPVISRIVLGLVLVAFVLPAWIWYIVPWAQMTEAELEAMIHAEIAKEEQAAAVQEDSLDGDDSS